MSRPSDLLGLVPYLLGFHPEESLVAMLIRDDRVLLTARMDLPPPGEFELELEQLRSLVRQHRCSGLVLVAYCSDAAAGGRLVELLQPGLDDSGLLDALVVDGSRWWSLLCSRGCCPVTGTPYDASTHPMAAEAVFAGLSAVSSRRDVVATTAGPAAEELPALRAVAVEVAGELADLTVEQRASMMSAAVADQLGGASGPDDRQCARLALLADVVEVRDVAWAMMSRDEADAHVELWSRVVARTVAPWQVAPLCLLGMAAWIAGNGALQNCCSQRAREADPTYSMAALLEEINLRALPPSAWDLMAAEVRTGAGLAAG